MKIVLDTHILLRAAQGELPKARGALLRGSANKLYVSAISLWEITKLCELGRITLPVEDGLREFLSRLERHPRYQVVGLTTDVLVKAHEIAKKLHGDPADQVIMATALVVDAHLMTDDRLLIRSKLVGVV